MKKFGGFPARMDFTPIPNVFFSSVLPQITDMAEMKATLHLLAALYRKRGYPRFAVYRELLGDAALMAGLRAEGRPPEEALRHGLRMAIDRGTVLQLVLDRDGEPEEVYFLNTEPDRQAVARIRTGELALTGLKAGRPTADVELAAPPNVFALYEENIGMLTPMIAEELREAEKLYPEAWIRDSIKEAVSLNKRSWRYIARILERWANEGRGSADGRDHKKTDPDKYIKGKYGHMVQR